MNMNSDDEDILPQSASSSSVLVFLRFLQMSNNNNDTSAAASDRSRALFIAYVCVLGCCCVMPCLYYIRTAVWQRQHIRRLREMEYAGMVAALAQSQLSAASWNNNNGSGHNNNNNSSSGGGPNAGGEPAAVREERRARILQLMEPVRMILKEAHFRNPHDAHSHQEAPLSNQQPLSETVPAADVDNGSSGEDRPPPKNEELGIWKRNRSKTVSGNTFSDDTSVSSADDMAPPPLYHFDEDEESILIEIPLPGLVFLQDTNNINGSSRSIGTTTSAIKVAATARTGTARLVPGFCTICLSGFAVGSDICWSSNRLCEHCFHCECMEHWLTKPQPRGQAAEGPICPCCRRDFILDPYDLSLQQEEEAEQQQRGTEDARDSTGRRGRNSSSSVASGVISSEAATPPHHPLELNWGDDGDDNDTGDDRIDADDNNIDDRRP